MDQPEHKILAEKLFTALRRFNRAFWQQNSSDGCKPSEVRVLFSIKKGMQSGSPIKVSEISKFLHVTPPTVTQLIKGLEANGLVERSIDHIDRRVVWLKLTEQGEKVTQKAEDELFSSLGGLINFMGEEQSNELVNLLSKAFLYFEERQSNVY